MENLFGFNYNVHTINNQDGSESRFAYVTGKNGMVVHTKKNTYNVIPTESISNIAQVFINQGYKVSPYTFKHGESIGFEVDFGPRSTELGVINYYGVFEVPQNGYGAARFLVREEKKICTNGMVRGFTFKNRELTIPHYKNFNDYVDFCQNALQFFGEIIESAIQQDKTLAGKTLDKYEFMKRLNEWFYETEIKGMNNAPKSPEAFRAELASEGVTDYKWYSKYRKFLTSIKRELEYGEQLNIKLSCYTMLMVVTNYLSRKREERNSKLPLHKKMVAENRKVRKMFVV